MPNLIKQSPITVLTSAEAAGAGVLAYLVAHGVISQHLAGQVGPYFVIAYVAVFGAVKWWNVMPWSRGKTLAQQLEAGGLHEADVARLEAVVDDLLTAHLGTSAEEVTGDDHPDSGTVGDPDVANAEADDAGMAAGAPVTV